jgi:hypothetical protein
LMQIIILGKTRPAAPEGHLPVAIIVHLHLIRRSFNWYFSKDGFRSSRPSINSVNFNGTRCCSRHWAPASAKKENTAPDNGWGGLGCATLTSRGSLICEEEALAMFLLPSGWPGRRLAGAEDDVSVVATLALFLLPQGRPRPCFSTTTLMRHGVDDVSHRLVGNPKRKVWWAQQQVFPSVRNQGLSVQEKAKLQKVMHASLVTLQQGHRLWHLLAHLQLAAMWNLHTTQPITLLPTYDEVVNLIGLL